ncbi:MAG TPA: hypothetical protein VFX18_05160, partial [Candidatus Nitrosocosmicus sp.]|nr:hypothetical protein [Candidatus Nitrosocosmicus sp.]
MHYYSFDKSRKKVYSLLLLVIISTSVMVVSFDKTLSSLISTRVSGQKALQSHSNSPSSTSNSTNTTTTITTSGKLRIYYIAADEVQWDYAPFGKNMITGKPFDKTANVFVQNSSDRI